MLNDDLKTVYVVHYECEYTNRIRIDGVFASWKAAADRISTICECDEDTYTITHQSLQTAKWAAERKKELETNRAKHKAEKSLAASEDLVDENLRTI